MQRQISTLSAGTLRKYDSYQYPSAHVGHLSEQQVTALQQFKDFCKEDGLYNPGNKNGEKPSHDDETLLRFLRARKFIPRDAVSQFKETEEWRKKNKIDELYQTIDVDDFDATRKLYPQWTGRRDKRGIPIYVFEVADLTSKRLAEYEKNTKSIAGNGNISPKLYRLFACYEHLVRFVLPLCSRVQARAYPETPVTQTSNIVDISKVGLKQFWNLKGHMQDASQLATAHYPETLDRIFIIGAPSFFPTVWGWIKRWFDPITVSKIFILSQASVQKTLEEYIDPEHIPKKYGGKLEWEWGQMPNIEPAIDSSLNWHKGDKGPSGKETLPRGPIQWKEDKDGNLAAVAVGSLDGNPRNYEVATLKETHDSLAHDATDALYGPPSTTGIHTHPSREQEYFPPSGQTPDEEDEPEPIMTAEAEANAGQGFTTPFMTPFELPKELGEVPREGTSVTRSEQQDETLAHGQLKSGTPATVDWGNGDKTVTMEPQTVGQAQKVVDTPEADQQKEGATYLEQAKAAASSALANGTEAISHAMAAVGLNNSTEKEATDEEVVHKKKPEDVRVDKMPTENVENFIRSNYANNDAVTVPKE